MRTLTFILLCTPALLSCSRLNGNAETGPADAIGDTPVRYVICNGNDTGCFVAARFDDFDSCERHNRISSMLCDSVTQPDQITCKINPDDSFSKGHCTK